LLAAALFTGAMNSSIAHLSSAQLRRAAALKDKLQTLEKELARLLGAAVPSAPAPAQKKKKKRMSKAARALISAAQKARWAKLKAAKKGQK
jgi:hypothetical protein